MPLQELSTRYDAADLQRFFKARPLLVWQRLGGITCQFAALIVRSYLRGGAAAVRNPPTDELCALLARLGPTFVKLGQTLSTREDLVGRDIARTLSNLQMAAPPFDDALAMAVIRDQLAGDPNTLYRDLSSSPVAAASLGQVYRGAVDVASGGNGAAAGELEPWDVAVKVQRPDLLGSIALDIYVLRLALGLVRRLAGINSDIRNIADEVGRGLFAELDYRVEASQARRCLTCCYVGCFTHASSLAVLQHRHVWPCACAQVVCETICALPPA
jgi:aarF domain-containing kinase